MKIYCDGSAKGNGKENSIGGVGTLCLNAEGTEIIDCLSKTNITENNPTNQQMELLAMALALESWCVPTIDIQVYTDSAYIYNCWKDEWYKKWLVNGWKNSKKEKVANKELWERLIPFFKNEKIQLVKVKGHNGNKYNELVDKLATGVMSPSDLLTF